jgi:hypothetical protein
VKKKSTSRFAFFSRRVLIGLPVLAGIFAVSLLLLLGNSSGNFTAEPKEDGLHRQTGTLEKMIVASGSVTMDVDLNRLNGISLPAAGGQRVETLHFDVKPNSFFTILVFNSILRGPESGAAMALTAQPRTLSRLPAALSASLNQLVVEKLPVGAALDLAVRDGKTGLVFFNIEGNLYNYDANAQLLILTEGKLLVSKDFANALGRPSDADSVVGKISIGAAMQAIEITQLVNGETKSVAMPPLQGGAGAEAPTLLPGLMLSSAICPPLSKAEVMGALSGWE